MSKEKRKKWGNKKERNEEIKKKWVKKEKRKMNKEQ